MEFNDVLAARKSVRRFADADLDDAEIGALLDAAQRAPVGSALYRDLHITVLRDRELMQALADAAAERRADRAAVEKTLDDGLKAHVAGAASAPFYGAPVVFVVSHRKQDLQPGIEFCNAAIVSFTMHLAAADLGLGSVIIWFVLETIRLRPELGLAERLGIPENFEPLLGLAAGRPEKKPEPRQLFRDRYAVRDCPPRDGEPAAPPAGQT
jgi:nitroreductase